MDPNATLAWLLAFATRHADGCPDHTTDGDGCGHADDLAEVSERIHALDAWLRRGGHPPTAWTPTPAR
jgi:hypothetical protein